MPTTADTMAATVPMAIAVCTGRTREESRLEKEVHRGSGDVQGGVIGDPLLLRPGFRDDQDPAVELQYIDVVSVEFAQDLGLHDLFGRAAAAARPLVR